MTAADYIALLGIALPLAGKVAVDFAALLAARKHNALANIVGMAGRVAASSARALADLPPGTQDPSTIERNLVAGSVRQISLEMGGSVAIKGATQDNLTRIVQGELDKIVTAKPVLPSIPRVPLVPYAVS